MSSPYTTVAASTAPESPLAVLQLAAERVPRSVAQTVEKPYLPHLLPVRPWLNSHPSWKLEQR